MCSFQCFLIRPCIFTAVILSMAMNIALPLSHAVE